MRGGAIVGWLGDVSLEDCADGAVAGSRRQVFDVFLVGADIADMREGEGDDLAEIGRVGQDLLVTGQSRVEAGLGLNLAGRTDAVTFDDRPVGKNEKGCRLAGGPGGCRGHGRSLFALAAAHLSGQLPRAIYVADRGRA